MSRIKLSILKAITTINESKALLKYIPCNCRYKSDERNTIQNKNGITINVNAVLKKQ